MKKIILFTFLFFPALCLMAQVEPEGRSEMKGRFDDAFTEVEDGLMTLRFINCENGKPVPDALVQVETLGVFTTDGEGKIRFPIMKDGTYHAKFLKEGFVKAEIPFEVVVGTIFQNRFSVSPILDVKYMRVALDWGKRPRDLDAHLEKKGSYHISYRDKKRSADGTARLDRDDIDGEGPETITVEDPQENAVYDFWVHDYTNRNDAANKKLSKSKATVSLWLNNEFIGKYTVPTGVSGNKWLVFSMVDGKIIERNQVQ